MPIINLPVRYVPNMLTRRDKRKQLNMLLKSKKMYKRHDYYTRNRVSSYKNAKSKHVAKALKMYNVDNILPTKALSLTTGCTVPALKKIVNKGEGAYFSSGSRPNQTAQSWGIARLASALTSGKAGAIDYNILINGCKPNSKGYKMAKLAYKKYGHGNRRVPKTKMI